MTELLITRLRITCVGNPTHWRKATPLIGQADQHLSAQHYGAGYVPKVFHGPTPTLFFMIRLPDGMPSMIGVLGRN